MKTEQELLASIKNNRAARVRFLMGQEKSQLVKLIERLGHFKPVDEDIAWLEKRIK